MINNKLRALYKKELGAYFSSPTAYIFAAIFLLINGYFFWVVVVDSKIASLRDTFSIMGSMLLFVTPLFTMRLIAEEKKMGTLELLFTSPISTRDIVLGKFFAAWTFYAAMFVITLVYPVALASIGRPEFWPIAGGYLGLFFIAGCYTSVGLFASSLTQNQIVAGILSFAFLLAFLVLDWLLDWTHSPLARSIVKNLSFFSHYETFTKGVVSSLDLFYFCGFIVVALVGTIGVLQMQRGD